MFCLDGGRRRLGDRPLGARAWLHAAAAALLHARQRRELARSAIERSLDRRGAWAVRDVPSRRARDAPCECRRCCVHALRHARRFSDGDDLHPCRRSERLRRPRADPLAGRRSGRGTRHCREPSARRAVDRGRADDTKGRRVGDRARGCAGARVRGCAGARVRGLPAPLSFRAERAARGCPRSGQMRNRDRPGRGLFAPRRSGRLRRATGFHAEAQRNAEAQRTLQDRGADHA